MVLKFKLKILHFADSYGWRFSLINLIKGMNDEEITKDEIVRASKLPISIIIVAIGGEDFCKIILDKIKNRCIN